MIKDYSCAMARINWRNYIHAKKVYLCFVKQLRAFAATGFYHKGLKKAGLIFEKSSKSFEVKNNYGIVGLT